MNAQLTVNGWLTRLNPADAAMKLNRYGQCRLLSSPAESCIVFVPAPASTEFHLFEDIAPLPTPCSAGVYEELLQLNLPGHVARGGSLAFDRLACQLVFSYSREIEATDARIFCTVLENFMNTVREIKKLVASLLSPEAGASGRTRSRPPRGARPTYFKS